MNVLRDKGKLYAPSLVLNSSSSFIGDTTRLNQDPNVVTEHITAMLIEITPHHHDSSYMFIINRGIKPQTGGQNESD